jgi:hypothetical protein
MGTQFPVHFVGYGGVVFLRALNLRAGKTAHNETEEPRNRRSIGLDKDPGSFFSSKAEAVIIEGDDTRTSRLDHLDFRILAQAHFVQTIYECVVTVDFDNAGTFAS